MFKRQAVTRLTDISASINQLADDLRAEAVLALMDGKLSLRNILVSPEGQFKRGWARDISVADVDQLFSGSDVLAVRLNRDGIYDYLPEALFHDIAGSDCDSGTDMAKESMRLRVQEREGRLFFQPLENEMFLQGLQVAAREDQLYRRIISQKLMGLIPDFWEIDPALPEKYVMRMVKLLPYAAVMAGNVLLIAHGLEFVLCEPATVKATRPPDIAAEGAAMGGSGVLGSCFLGVDAIAGDALSGAVKQFIVSIGPVVNPETVSMLKNGSLEKFLDCFYSYFIPVEADVSTQFVLAGTQGEFVLEGDDPAVASHLGYNSII